MGIKARLYFEFLRYRNRIQFVFKSWIVLLALTRGMWQDDAAGQFQEFPYQEKFSVGGLQTSSCSSLGLFINYVMWIEIRVICEQTIWIWVSNRRRSGPGQPTAVTPIADRRAATAGRDDRRCPGRPSILLPSWSPYPHFTVCLILTILSIHVTNFMDNPFLE